MKDPRTLFKRLGLLFGVGALTFISDFLEWVGIISMAAALVFLVIYYVRSKKAPACDIDCACRDKKGASQLKP
jgi:hypothetical protein